MSVSTENMQAHIDPLEIQAWIRLSAIAELDIRFSHALLSEFGLPQNIFEASYRELLRHVPDTLVRRIKEPIHDTLAHTIELTLTWLEDPENHLLTLSDTRYPISLLELPSPPLVLYAKGDTSLLSTPILAISGEIQNPSKLGLLDAQSFATEIARHGITIATGLSLGIEQAAIQGALDAQAKTIAVFATGLDKVYPAKNLSLAHAIASSGCLISPFVLDTNFSKDNLPLRNHILSALSRGLFVIEAARNSLTMSLAKSAIDNGRDIFVIPGSIHDMLSRGSNALIKQGAKLVETAQDVINEFK